MKIKYFVILILAVIGVVLISGCVQQQKPVKDGLQENKSLEELTKVEETEPEETQEEKELEPTKLTLFRENSHFGFMHPEYFEEMVEFNVHWQRPHAGPFIWNEIEPGSGQFDWTYADKVVKESQNHDINILATIWPFAEWDQSSCRQKLPAEKNRRFS